MSIATDQFIKELRVRVEDAERRLSFLEEVVANLGTMISREKHEAPKTESKIDRRTREWKNANLPRS